MPTVIMPKMGDAMEEGTVVKWLKAEGDTVAKDEPIAEIETDKATLELTAEYAGTLSKRIAGEGESVAIGKPIATIIGAGESPEPDPGPAPAPTQQAQAAPPAAQGRAEGGETTHGAIAEDTAPSQQGTVNGGSAPKGAEAPAAPAPAGSGDRIKASPLARRIAQEHEIDLRNVRGSGPNGRIVREDVEAALRQPQGDTQPQAATAAPAPQQDEQAAPTQTAAPQSGAGDRQVPLSRMRNAIARQMVTSKTTIPHFYVSVEVDMTEALAWRKRLNEAAAADGYKITVNDMIVKACGLALAKFPNLNSSFGGDHIVMHDEINVSIAVALKEGLIAPVVRGVDKKSLGTVAREGQRSRQSRPRGEAYPGGILGGTFTVSNLGPFGVETFIAIVTAPQAAALAVGSSAQKAVVVDGQIVVRDRMNVTLSADHRLTDGAEGAQFVSEVRRLLENPLALLM
jgi:pyruvate dehydrogenase E2 component (dihydrolipoamide acetyltransferase)